MYNYSTIPSVIKTCIRQFLTDSLASDHREEFFAHPGKDFTRNRKLNLEDLVFHLLSRSSGSLTHNLQADFGLGDKRPSKSALVQQQAKLTVGFFEKLFFFILGRFHQELLYKGKYRLLACDGSDIGISGRNADCYSNTNQTGRRFCSLHLNALYDILSESFVDCIIERGKRYNETAACWKMMERQMTPAIVICDRNYGSYNLFAHLMKAGQFFLIRVKDVASDNGMACLWWPRLNGPDGKGEVLVDTRLTRVHANTLKEDGGFHPIPQNMTFDFLPQRSPFKQGRKRGKTVAPEDIPPEHFYRLRFRLVRFRINPPGSQNEFETVATNLPPDEFPPDELKRLYGLRWGEETGFRELKYDELLSRLHSVKAESVMKEIYLALTMHNITAYLLSFVGRKLAKGKGPAADCYAASHSDASHAVRLFLRRTNRDGPVKLMQELARNMEPVRDDRSFPRQLIRKGFFAFTYRAA